MTDTTQPHASPPPLPSAAPPAAALGEPVSISWSGSVWSLAGLGFINFLLTVVTLGIYHFWAKTEVRRRIVSSIRINSEPMEYTGTGKELFLGFLIVLFAILIPIQLILVGSQLALGPLGGLVVFLVLPLIWYLYGVAVYRARRYRRSRLRWRGIRGAVTGSSWAYGWHSMWTTIVNALVSGWLTPWRDNFLHRTVTNETRFGDRSLSYKGKAGPLYPSYTLAWLGSFVLLLVVGGFAALVLWPMSEPLRQALEATNANNGGTEFNDYVKAHPEIGLLIVRLVGVGYAFLALFGLLASVLWSLFYAREFRYFTGETRLDTISFKLDVSGWSMFWMFFTNTLLSLLTVTILSPVAEARVARYFISRLTASGSADFASILQSQERLSRTGEGLAEAFDVEASSYFILSI